MQRNGRVGAGIVPAAGRWIRRNAGRMGGLVHVALLVLGFSLATPAMAMVHVVDPGETPKLDADEGLLLVGVDSNFDLDSVRVAKRNGALLTSGVFNGIKAGQNARLYAVPAGHYMWDSVATSWRAVYAIADKAEFHFDVTPGKITYAGDLVFRPVGPHTAKILVSNRGLRAMDWLEAQHPQLAREYEFVFAGHYPDPFPAFYKTERAASTASVAVLSAVEEPPKPSALPLAIRDLWREPHIYDISLNPAGDLLVEAVRIKEKKRWGLDLVDLATRKVRRLDESDKPFVSLNWSGDRQLLSGVGERARRQQVTLFSINDDADRTVISQRISVLGHVLASNYGIPNQVLFESYRDDGRVLVSPLDLTTRESILSFHPLARGRLNVGVDDDLTWLADGRGRLRAAIARHDDRIVLMHGIDGHFSEVFDLSEESAFLPQALSYDGELIYGITEEGRGQRDLVEFDPRQRKVTRTLFSKPGVDMEGPVVDDQGRVIGALHYEGGRLISDYFDAGQQQIAQLLARAFPGKTTQVGARSRDGRRLVVWVQGSDQSPMLYSLDVTTGTAALLDAAFPWLKNRTFAPTEVLHVRSRDGLPIEAYLTLPKEPGKHPLVVHPHGGPVGVRDVRLFDPEVQFLASLGYAILQVNFRGSDGYGRAFRHAGYGQLGTGIEDDIDAALQEAISRFPIDASRMCIMGASYGGYSALQSTIRWPGRYRCAISMSGVSDWSLVLTASDGSNWAEGREALERMVGNPNTELDKLLSTSPLYHYRDIHVPLMLVHGREDTRVDYEHSRRLVRMLNLAGHKPVMLSFDKEGHGLDDIDDIETAYRGIAGFLQQYLGTAQSAATVVAPPTLTPASAPTTSGGQ